MLKRQRVLVRGRYGDSSRSGIECGPLLRRNALGQLYRLCGQDTYTLINKETLDGHIDASTVPVWVGQVQ